MTTKKEKVTSYEEVEKATKASAEKGESIKDYTERAGNIISKMNDDQFNTLSKGVQDWFNSAVEWNGDEKKSPPALDGFPTEEQKTETSSKKSAGKGTKSVVHKNENKEEKKLAKPASKKKDVAIPSKAKAETRPKEKFVSVSKKIVGAVVRNPTADFATIAKAVGIEPVIGGYTHYEFTAAKKTMAAALEYGYKK